MKKVGCRRWMIEQKRAICAETLDPSPKTQASPPFSNSHVERPQPYHALARESACILAGGSVGKGFGLFALILDTCKLLI